MFYKLIYSLISKGCILINLLLGYLCSHLIEFIYIAQICMHECFDWTDLRCGIKKCFISLFIQRHVL